jgi:hypothetical protein
MSAWRRIGTEAETADTSHCGMCAARNPFAPILGTPLLRCRMGKAARRWLCEVRRRRAPRLPSAMHQHYRIVITRPSA